MSKESSSSGSSDARARGFTLIEVLLAMSLTTIVSVAVGELLSKQFRLQSDVSEKSQLASLHAVGLQRARNTNWVTEQILLDPSGARKPRLDRCLNDRAQSTDDCTQEAFSKRQIASLSTGRDEFSQTTSASIVCSMTNCSRVELDVATQEIGKATSPRQSRIVLSSLALASLEDIQFACGASSPVTSVNMSTRSANCTSLVTGAGARCPSSVPILKFGTSKVCETTASETCTTAQGLLRVGLATGESICGGAVAL